MTKSDRSKTYRDDCSNPRGFGKIKTYAIKPVKSIVIAMVCITGGVVAGTPTQAAQRLASQPESRPLTIVNDTRSEVLIFLHKEGETRPYTRYAYLPPCSVRPLTSTYLQGWQISQSLRSPVPIKRLRTDANRVYISGFNNRQFQDGCAAVNINPEARPISTNHATPDEDVVEIAINPLGFLKGSTMVAEAASGRYVNHLVEELADNLMHTQWKWISKAKDGISKAKDEFVEILETVVKFGPEQAVKDHNIPPETASGISNAVAGRTADDFIKAYYDLVKGEVTDDDKIILKKADAQLEVIKRDQWTIDDIKAWLEKSCGIKDETKITQIARALFNISTVNQRQKVVATGEEASTKPVALMNDSNSPSIDPKENCIVIDRWWEVPVEAMPRI